MIQREEKPHPSPGGVSFCARSPRAGEHLTQTGKDRIIIQLTKTFLWVECFVKTESYYIKA